MNVPCPILPDRAACPTGTVARYLRRQRFTLGAVYIGDRRFPPLHGLGQARTRGVVLRAGPSRFSGALSSMTPVETAENRLQRFSHDVRLVATERGRIHGQPAGQLGVQADGLA